MSKEYKNEWRGISILIALTALVSAALWLLSYEEGAGTASFHISLGVVFGEALLILIHYRKWYRSVNDEAKHMFDLSEMQKMGKKKAFRMQGRLLVLSLVVAGAGAALILFGVLFSGISSLFSYSAVLCELLAGNLFFHLLTHKIFLPDRIIGRC